MTPYFFSSEHPWAPAERLRCAEQISLYHCRPIYGAVGEAQENGFSHIAGLAKANVFVHLAVD